MIYIELVNRGKQKKLLDVNRGMCIDWFVQVSDGVGGYRYQGCSQECEN